MSNQLSEHIRPIQKEYLDTDEYPTIHVETPQGNTLDFCGIAHSNNPDNPNDKYMIDRVKQELGDFLSRPSEHEKIVLLEGWKGPRTTMDDLSEDVLVRLGGEEALADRMARQAGVEIASPEPAGKEEFEQLCKEFPSDEVFYWYVARQAVQWGREEAVPFRDQTDELHERRELVQDKFYELTTKLEDTLGHPPSFRETVGSFELLSETHQRLFGNEIDWNDIGHFEAHANPLDDNSVINKIHNRSNQIRDEHIAQVIQEQIHAGKDVFCVYGDGHAYTLEPALLELGKQEQELSPFELTTPESKTYSLGEQYSFLVHVPLGDIAQRVGEIGSERGGVLMTSLINEQRQGTFCGEGGLLLQAPIEDTINGMSRVDCGGEIADGRMDSVEELAEPAANTEYNQIDLQFDGTKVVGVMLKVAPDGQELGNQQRNARLREIAESHNLPVAIIIVAPSDMPSETSSVERDFSDGNTLTTYDIPDGNDHFLRVDIAHGNFYHSPGLNTISRSMIIDCYGQVSQQLSVEQEQHIQQELTSLQAQNNISQEEIKAVIDGFLPRESWA